MRTAPVLIAVALLSGCTGEVMEMPLPQPHTASAPPVVTPGGAVFTPPSPAALFTEQAYGKSGVQRLTRHQLFAVLQDIFGVAVGATDTWAPSDSPSSTYFENDYTALAVSDQLIADYESFATEYSKLVAADHSTFTARVGCTPSGPTDAACFRRFTEVIGRRVFRRPITAAESQRWADALLPFAQRDDDFFSAVDAMVAVWLQHPEFLYRVEKGAVSPGSFQSLDQFEVATRIAFLTTGLGPDDTLLDAAAADALTTDSQRSTHAERLLASTAGVSQAKYFHTRWLGYADTFFPAAIGADAFDETAALVEQVTADASRDWLTLFSAEQTMVTPALATHYGLPAPAGARGWVSYPAGRGGGVLSHASVSSLGAKFGDTSPTLRGYEMLKRVYCGALSGSIPAGVDIDSQPGSPTDCKTTRYFQRNTAACSQCHGVTDNLGFGLENLGAYGEWREVESTNAACVIDGKGSMGGVSFTGPAQLGTMMASDPRVAQCAAKQMFQLLVGRRAQLDDQPTLEALQGQYYLTKSYRSLLLALVQSPAITHKGAN